MNISSMRWGDGSGADVPSSNNDSISTTPSITTITAASSSSFITAELARMMIPTDANVAGNVHGGTIMQLMEEAAGVAAHRYFANNNAGGSSSFRKKTTGNHAAAAAAAAGGGVPLLSRVERLTFQRPIHVGDVAKVRATVVFASQHSVAVCVQVRAERMAWSHYHRHNNNDDDNDTICNRSLMWLVGAAVMVRKNNIKDNNMSSFGAKDDDEELRALAPPFPIPSPTSSPWAWKQYQEAASLYEKNRRRLLQPPTSSSPPSPLVSNSNSHLLVAEATPTPAALAYTPDHSAVELAQVMLPSDCVSNHSFSNGGGAIGGGLVSGGIIMKLMDNACGIVATRHCGSNTVTVAVQGVDFIQSVQLGDIVLVKARAVFYSSKSLEIGVHVNVERHTTTEQQVEEQEQEDTTTSTTIMRLKQEIIPIVAESTPAYFTFVALPNFNKRDNSNNDNDDDDGATRESALPMRPLRLVTKRDRENFHKRKFIYEQQRSLRRGGSSRTSTATTTTNPATRKLLSKL